MVTPEFVDANAEYFSMHFSKFDENEDENKHEYMQLFEEYLSLQEKVIESKLRLDHNLTDEQI